MARPGGRAICFVQQFCFSRSALHFPKNTKWELVAMKNSNGTDRKKLVRDARKA
jgi:hypothetical protein